MFGPAEVGVLGSTVFGVGLQLSLRLFHRTDFERSLLHIKLGFIHLLFELRAAGICSELFDHFVMIFGESCFVLFVLFHLLLPFVMRKLNFPISFRFRLPPR